MRGQPGHDTQPYPRLPSSLLGMDAWMISQLNAALWVIYVGHCCAWLMFDMLSMGVCTTRHWQTSGRLVQELNVCTVHVKRAKHINDPCPVTAFNSCTRCMGSPGMKHDRTPNCHLGSWVCMRPHVPDLSTERSIYLQATWVINVLGLCFFTWYPWLYIKPGTGRCPVDWCRN